MECHGYAPVLNDRILRETRKGFVGRLFRKTKILLEVDAKC